MKAVLLGSILIVSCGFSENKKSSNSSQQLELNKYDSINQLFESKQINYNSFVLFCSDTLIGQGLINETFDENKRDVIFLLKTDLKNVNLNTIFNLTIKNKILESINNNNNIDNDIYVSINMSNDEFESSKIFYFKREKNILKFKGILIAG